MDETFAHAMIWLSTIFVVAGGFLHARACLIEAKTYELLDSIINMLALDEVKNAGTDAD